MNPNARQILTEWLVLTAQGGDERAFRDLHDLWRADLRRLALIKVQDSRAADEVATDAWLAIARGLPRLEDPACFPRWAFRIVDRRSADWIRRRELERRHELAAAGEAAELTPAGSAPAEPADDVARLRAAIARLTAEQQELLQLFYDLERPVPEIAEILGIPAGTVKSRLFSVRETLKRELERKSHE